MVPWVRTFEFTREKREGQKKVLETFAPDPSLSITHVTTPYVGLYRFGAFPPVFTAQKAIDFTPV